MSTQWKDVYDLIFVQPGIVINFSIMHLVVPAAVIFVLAVLCVVMLIQRALRCKRDQKPFFNFKEYRFFSQDFNPFVFIATIVLMILYIWLLPKMGFLAGSILFLFLFNTLYNRPYVANVQEDGTRAGYTVRWKSIIVSVAISVIAPLIIWYVFGVLFKLTLP